MTLRAVLNTLLPRRCPGCHGQLGQASGLCPPCQSSLQAQVQSHSPLEDIPRPHLVVLGTYQGVLGRSVRALKYGGSRDLAGILGAGLALGVPADWNLGAVASVPLHPARQRERGFNQAALLAQSVASSLGLPYLETLIRQRSTGAQARRHAQERLGALDDAFLALPGMVLPDRILLVDDVMTTGTTLSACRRALQDAGVSQIYFAAVAR